MLCGVGYIVVGVIKNYENCCFDNWIRKLVVFPDAVKYNEKSKIPIFSCDNVTPSTVATDG